MPPQTPPPGDGFLPRFPGESEREYRMFLLWAMQDPMNRVKALTARAFGCSRKVVRNNKERFQWKERVRLVGVHSGSDGIAFRTFLEHYCDPHGVRAIGIVQPNMQITGLVTPLAMIRSRLSTSGDPTDYERNSAMRAALEGLEDLSADLIGVAPARRPQPRRFSYGLENWAYGKDPPEPRAEAPPEPEPSPEQREASRLTSEIVGEEPTVDPKDARGIRVDPDRRAQRVEEYRKLVRASIGVYARQLQTGKIKFSGRDLQGLIDLDQALMGYDEEERVGPQESVRIRMARASGESLLPALQRDHEELGVILRALRDHEEQGREHLAVELEQARAAGRVVDIAGQKTA